MWHLGFFKNGIPKMTSSSADWLWRFYWWSWTRLLSSINQ